MRVFPGNPEDATAYAAGVQRHTLQGMRQARKMLEKLMPMWHRVAQMPDPSRGPAGACDQEGPKEAQERQRHTAEQGRKETKLMEESTRNHRQGGQLPEDKGKKDAKAEDN